MRLTIYIVIAVVLLIIASYFNHPIQTYLTQIKNQSAAGSQQIKMVRVDVRLTALQRQMTELMAFNSSMYQAHVSLIHSAISAEGNRILQYDITASAAGIGHVAGPLMTNLPLVNWTDYLRILLAHECVLVKTSNMTNRLEKLQLVNQGIVISVACPILNKRGQLLGAVFVNWNKLETVPQDISPTIESIRRSAKNVALLISDE